MTVGEWQFVPSDRKLEFWAPLICWGKTVRSQIAVRTPFSTHLFSRPRIITSSKYIWCPVFIHFLTLGTNHLMTLLADCHVTNQSIPIQHQILWSHIRKSSIQWAWAKICHSKRSVRYLNNSILYSPTGWIISCINICNWVKGPGYRLPIKVHYGICANRLSYELVIFKVHLCRVHSF